MSLFVIATRVSVSVVLTVAIAAVVACGGSGDKTTTVTAPAATTTSGVQGASEVQAVPVSDTGDNPFTDSVGSNREGVTPPEQQASSAGPQSVRGSLPGLYGGTRDNGSCDAGKLIGYLEQTPDKAAAWAGVLGIQPTEIRDYVSKLTPVTLRTDTRVTNHGFANGQATPAQAVLQAGTAVFVDEYGRPVVKCNCGNPLKPPVLYPKPTYTGSRWPGFSTTNITIIRRSVTIVQIFVIWDFNTGTLINRPPGTSGEADTTPTATPPPDTNGQTTTDDTAPGNVYTTPHSAPEDWETEPDEQEQMDEENQNTTPDTPPDSSSPDDGAVG